MKPAIHTLVIAISLLATAAHAQVTVKDAWVRATVPQQKATGAFMQLSAPKDMKLVSASSPVIPIVEVHEMAMQDNIMRMRQVPAVGLPAGKNVELKPGGYHVMLMGLKQQVKEGDTVPLILVFEDKDGKRETQEVMAKVRALNTAAQPAAHGESGH
ncbi:copper chaperone PCu(A)C [Polaromonas sp. YR568]|uniref:copper chaperone PCu(A)C n=1 Tax=Polaromonas sp. YR568 TaxID=1855301 RepID=UPI00398BBFEA